MRRWAGVDDGVDEKWVAKCQSTRNSDPARKALVISSISSLTFPTVTRGHSYNATLFVYCKYQIKSTESQDTTAPFPCAKQPLRYLLPQRQHPAQVQKTPIGRYGPGEPETDG